MKKSSVEQFKILVTTLKSILKNKVQLRQPTKKVEFIQRNGVEQKVENLVSWKKKL